MNEVVANEKGKKQANEAKEAIACDDVLLYRLVCVLQTTGLVVSTVSEIEVK